MPLRSCPQCGKVIDFNSYFGAYICDDCGWEDNTYFRERVEYYSKRRDRFEEEKRQQELALEKLRMSH